MKTINLYATASLVALALVFSSCSKDELDTPFYTADNGVSKELSHFEEAGLISLLETEKMHKDVYNWINAQFPSEVFVEMGRRDGQCMELLSVKVDKYGLANPTVDKAAGEFEDATIQDRYDEFVRSTAGNLEAMIDGAKAMEEAFIAEVQVQEAALSGNADIRVIYNDLIKTAVSQLNTLNDETKGLIHIYAPKDPDKEM